MTTTITDPKDLTAEETEAVMLAALEQRDFEAVVAFLKLLCTKDARRASDLYDAMLLGIEIAQHGGPDAAVQRVAELLGVEL